MTRHRRFAEKVRRIGKLIFGIPVVVLLLLATSTMDARRADAVEPRTSKFVPSTPTRLLDTRSRGVMLTEGSVVALTVPATEATVSAVVINLTAVDATAPGFLTAFPDGVDRPESSNVNVSVAGQTIAGLATVPVDDRGRFVIYASMLTHVVVDLFGTYQAASSATDGRLITLPPTRVLDTRNGTALLPGQDRVVPVGHGVPSDASAVVVNVTATGARAAGFLTVWAAGSARPSTSNLNVSRTGETLANQVISPMADGAIQIYSQSGGDVLVDVVGYFTGRSAPLSSDGLFVPMTPTRLMDTRAEGVLNPMEDRLKPRRDWTVEVRVLGSHGVPARVAAVAMTTTVVDAEGPGFLTVWSAGSNKPATSNLNASRRGQTVANHAISPLSYRGVSVFTSSPMHVLVDVSGWFTGSPGDAPLRSVENVLPAVQGRLSIPAIGLNSTLGDGLDDAALNVGPMHWSLSSMPGELGTMSILGHRTSHGAPFRRIGDLRPGDLIAVTNAGASFTYQVQWTRIVDPDAVLGLVDNGTANLNLVACHPIGSQTQRIVVRAELVG